MASRKAIRASEGQVPGKSVRTSKFPADRLPSELIHTVFAYLEPKEAALFRWAGRVIAEIGLQYLTSKVYLRLREESYDRLLAVAEHPVASKCVVELEYETEGFRSINREKFDHIFSCTDLRSQRHDSSERELGRNMPLSNKKRTRRHTMQLLNRAWSMYEEYQAGHKKVEEAEFFRAKMVEAFKRLPKLKIISIPVNSAYERYIAEIKLLLPTYSFSDGKAYGDPLCLGATSSVLLAAESAGLQLSSFHCQRFNWRTLNQKVSLPTLSRSISHLKVLNITFEPGHICQNGSHVGIDPSSFECSQNGHLSSFITSAPNLERLEVTFNMWPCYYTGRGIKEIVKDFNWLCLKAISLDRLVLSEHYLVHFFERHKHTLREIQLRHMRMVPGLWHVTFHDMRRTFKFGHQLDTCKLGGIFRDPQMVYWMESIRRGNIFATGTMISDYIQATNLGDITLTDYWEVMKS